MSVSLVMMVVSPQKIDKIQKARALVPVLDMTRDAGI